MPVNKAPYFISFLKVYYNISVARAARFLIQIPFYFIKQLSFLCGLTVDTLLASLSVLLYILCTPVHFLVRDVNSTTPLSVQEICAALVLSLHWPETDINSGPGSFIVISLCGSWFINYDKLFSLYSYHWTFYLSVNEFKKAKKHFDLVPVHYCETICDDCRFDCCIFRCNSILRSGITNPLETRFKPLLCMVLCAPIHPHLETVCIFRSGHAIVLKNGKDFA